MQVACSSMTHTTWLPPPHCTWVMTRASDPQLCTAETWPWGAIVFLTPNFILAAEPSCKERTSDHISQLCLPKSLASYFSVHVLGLSLMFQVHCYLWLNCLQAGRSGFQGSIQFLSLARLHCMVLKEGVSWTFYTRRFQNYSRRIFMRKKQ
jgi:hypothetical protein